MHTGQLHIGGLTELVEDVLTLDLHAGRYRWWSGTGRVSFFATSSVAGHLSDKSEANCLSKMAF